MKFQQKQDCQNPKNKTTVQQAVFTKNGTTWWYTPFDNVRKYTFTYDGKNNQTYKLTKLNTDLFWE